MLFIPSGGDLPIKRWLEYSIEILLGKKTSLTVRYGKGLCLIGKGHHFPFTALLKQNATMYHIGAKSKKVMGQTTSKQNAPFFCRISGEVDIKTGFPKSF